MGFDLSRDLQKGKELEDFVSDLINALPEHQGQWDLKWQGVQVKTLQPGGRIPVESWSVIEKRKVGWAWEADPSIPYYFVAKRKDIIIILSGEEIAKFATETLEFLGTRSLQCRICKTVFELADWGLNGKPLWQTIQRTPVKGSNYCDYHSACLFVKPEQIGDFRKLTLTSHYKPQKVITQGRLF